ncbi:hypothetical protein EBZ38_01275, partial [bacterium]|nr:hypothetical protein [bacterium]
MSWLDKYDKGGNNKPFRRSVSKEYTEEVQRTLNKKYGTNLKVDGIWGPLTENAYQQYWDDPNAKKIALDKFISVKNNNDLRAVNLNVAPSVTTSVTIPNKKIASKETSNIKKEAQRVDSKMKKLGLASPQEVYAQEKAEAQQQAAIEDATNDTLTALDEDQEYSTWDVIGNPMTALRTYNVYGYIPRGFNQIIENDRNVIDIPLSMINPAQYINAAGRVLDAATTTKTYTETLPKTLGAGLGFLMNETVPEDWNDEAFKTIGLIGDATLVSQGLKAVSNTSRGLRNMKSSNSITTKTGETFEDSKDFLNWYQKTQNNRPLLKKEINFLNKELQQRGILETQRSHPLNPLPKLVRRGLVPEDYNVEKVIRESIPNIVDSYTKGMGSVYSKYEMGPGRLNAFNQWLGLPTKGTMYRVHPQSFQNGKGLLYTTSDDAMRGVFSKDLRSQVPTSEHLIPLSKNTFNELDIAYRMGNKQPYYNDLRALNYPTVKNKAQFIDELGIQPTSNPNVIIDWDKYTGTGGGVNWLRIPKKGGGYEWIMRDTWDIQPFSRQTNLPKFIRDIDVANIIGAKNFDVNWNYITSPKFNKIINPYYSGSSFRIKKEGGDFNFIVDPKGQWAHPGKPTMIPTDDGRITMQGVPYPVFGVDDLGNQQMMYPGMNYQFPGTMVYETPMMQSGGWLNKYQDGGMPLDLPLKSANPGSPWAYESPQANGYLLPDVNRPELLNTGATEYKMEIDNDVTIPTVVNGQYMDPDQAYQRYLLTGEQFKPMVDPGSYSKFYDTVRPLGLMQYQDGGVKTFDEYEYTVKDGIYTIRTKGSEEWRTLDEGRSKAFQSLIDISNPTKKKKPADKGVVDKMFSDILGPYKKKVEPVKPKEETKPMVERSAFSMVAPTLDSAISGIEYPEKVINNEQKEIAKFRVDPEFIMSPYKDKDTAVEEYKKYPTYALRYKNTSDYTPEDITNIQSYLDRKGLYPEGKKQINPSDYTTPEQILELQRYLVKEGLAQTLGLSSTNATLSGKLDKNTTAAIEKFNKSNSKFTPGSLDTNTRDAIRNYRNISDAQSAIGIPTRNPFDLYDAQTQSPRVEDTYQAMSDFENELMKRGFFRGDVKYDFTPKEGKQLIGYKFMYNPDTDSDDAGVYGCAEYVNKMVCGEDVAAEDIREELGFKGDAWSISENLQAKGGKLIFAGLPERSQSPVKQGDDLRTYLKTTLNNPEVKTNLQQLLNTGNIKPGDVVNIFYEGSSETDKAFNQTAEVNGRFFTTHVGIVKKGKDGKLYVEHNVHKVLHRDPIQDFLDNKVPGNGKGKVSLIAGITRPNYYQGVVDDEGRIGPEGISYYQTEYGQFNPSGALANKDDWAGQMIGGKNIYDYLSVIENNKDAILKDIPITENEFGKLMRVARIIPVKETSASADYEKLNYRPVDESGMLKVNVDALKAAEQLGLRDEVSMGFTRLKDESNLNPNLRAALYNDDDTQLDDPAKAAIPTFYVLSKNYLYLKEVMNEYGIKLTSDQLAKLAGLGYNQSIGKIAAQVIE